MADLVSEVIAASGGADLWAGLDGLSVEISIGGPLWPVKGWPGGVLTERLEIDTRSQTAAFSPFARPDRRVVYRGESDSVTVTDEDGTVVQELTSARSSFRTHLRATPWDEAHLGYFLGYACWNYLTTPFLFRHPGVVTRELEPWQESGQTWRRLHVRFPDTVGTHDPEQVFHFDHDGLQRRMDYVTEVLGSTLVGHYTSRHRDFGGLVVPTRRRVYRRNPDGSVNLNLPSITLDVHDVQLVRSAS